MTKNILIIDYHFPPMAGVGVQRTLGYVRHLAEFGWQPVVLTVRPGDKSSWDRTLLERVPGTVNIQRTASIDPVRLSRRMSSRRAAGPTPDTTAGPPERSQGDRPWKGPRWIRDAQYWIFFPDQRIGWLPFALARAVGLSRVLPIDVIYSTSGAITSHLIACVLKRVLGKPWVADFQDPWVQDPYFRSLPVHRKLGEWIEHTILQQANRVTFTTEPLRAMFQQKYASIPPGKLTTISMGFDPDVLHGIEASSGPKFTITHFGTFYDERSPGPFLEALAQCVNAEPSLARNTEVLFFGSFAAEMLTMTEALLEQHDLDFVHLKGVVPYKTGLKYLMSSNVLLLVTAPGMIGRNLVPSKVFDYLATGKPMLVLAPEGAVTRIVRSANAGLIADPDNVRAIKESLLEMYRRWVDGHLAFHVDQEFVAKFTWRELTRQFVCTLQQATREA